MSHKFLLALVGLLAVTSVAFAASSNPMNAFAASIAELDRAIQQITSPSSSNNSTTKSFVPAPNACDSAIATFEAANPSIASLNAKIQEYTQAFYTAQIAGLVNKAQKATENTRIKVNAPVTPFYDFHFHELCASAGGRVCAAKLEMEIKITTSPHTIKLEVEASAARCLPARKNHQKTETDSESPEQSAQCMSHQNIQSLQEEIVSMCESLNRAGVDVKECDVSAHCGPQPRTPTMWMVVGIPIFIGVFAVVMVVMLIKRIRAFAAARRGGCGGHCSQATSAEHKYERVETEPGTPMMMVVPTPTPVAMPGGAPVAMMQVPVANYPAHYPVL